MSFPDEKRRKYDHTTSNEGDGTAVSMNLQSRLSPPLQNPGLQRSTNQAAGSLSLSDERVHPLALRLLQQSLPPEALRRNQSSSAATFDLESRAGAQQQPIDASLRNRNQAPSLFDPNQLDSLADAERFLRTRNSLSRIQHLSSARQGHQLSQRMSLERVSGRDPNHDTLSEQERGTLLSDARNPLYQASSMLSSSQRNLLDQRLSLDSSRPARRLPELRHSSSAHIQEDSIFSQALREASLRANAASLASLSSRSNPAQDLSNLVIQARMAQLENELGRAQDLSNLAMQARVLQLEHELEQERQATAAVAAHRQQITDSLVLRLMASNPPLIARQSESALGTGSLPVLNSGRVAQQPAHRNAFCTGRLDGIGEPAASLNSIPLQTSAASLATASRLLGISGPSSTDPIARQANNDETTSVLPIGPVSLALESDQEKLSPYQILLRKQLEFFVATREDVDCGAQGRKKEVYVGQVGVRCRHCANRPPGKKRPGAAYYPAKVGGVYQAAQNMSKTHLLHSCGDIDQDLRQELQKLYDRHDTANGGRVYWANGCYNLGVYETDSGLRLRGLPQQGTASI